jgi:hypothetical protein
LPAGEAAPNRNSGAFNRTEVIVENADDVCSGKDHAQLESELCWVGVHRQLVLCGGSLSLPFEQVTPLLLDACHFVVDATRAGSDLGGGGDEETAAGEDPPLDIGEIAVTECQ